jgi:galacturan 1,4-alpha-galacturonidase
MINSAKAVGIKLWEGGSAHGIATVSNVTWTGITVQNCGYAIQIQSCYEAANTSSCISNTDSLTGVVFTGFTGTTYAFIRLSFFLWFMYRLLFWG